MQAVLRQTLLNIADSWRSNVSQHPLITLGLLFSLLAITALVAINLLNPSARVEPVFFKWAVIGGLIGAASTALGAMPGLVIRQLSAVVEDSMLGVAAGMMLAASFFSLILPGLEVSTGITGSDVWAVLVIIAGMTGGVLLMLGLDSYLPHEHAHIGAFGAGHEQMGKVWLFVLAIALHNFPEGMAIGVSYTDGNLSVGIPLTAAIAIQNLPEGLAVVFALRRIQISTPKAVGVAAATGLVEPVGAVFGIFMASGLPLSYPLGLGIAAGAMIFVVSHEVIPETHRNGHQTPATVGLMAGFVLIMLMDTLLG